MKGLRVAIRFVVAGVLLVGVALAISFASFRAGFNARCKTGNLNGRSTPERIKRDSELGWSSLNHALVCTIGEYEIAVPTESAQGHAGIVLRNGRPFVVFNEKRTELFDDSGERALFTLEQTSRGSPELPMRATTRRRKRGLRISTSGRMARSITGRRRSRDNRSSRNIASASSGWK
jgi:hypothetical protein